MLESDAGAQEELDAAGWTCRGQQVVVSKGRARRLTLAQVMGHGEQLQGSSKLALAGPHRARARGW